jgi:hypothetical protein
MDIKLKNLDEQRVLAVKGLQVSVLMQDDGQALVTMSLTIADGTHFHYPDDQVRGVAGATRLAPGLHHCALRIAALNLPPFGRTYKSKVSIDGVVVATAQGTLAPDVQDDSAVRLFSLQVG